MNEDKTPSETYINGDHLTTQSQDSNEPLIEHAPPVIEPRNSLISDEDNDDEGIVSIISPMTEPLCFVSPIGFQS